MLTWSTCENVQLSRDKISFTRCLIYFSCEYRPNLSSCHKREPLMIALELSVYLIFWDMSFYCHFLWQLNWHKLLHIIRHLNSNCMRMLCNASGHTSAIYISFKLKLCNNVDEDEYDILLSFILINLYRTQKLRLGTV